MRLASTPEPGRARGRAEVPAWFFRIERRHCPEESVRALKEPRYGAGGRWDRFFGDFARKDYFGRPTFNGTQMAEEILEVPAGTSRHGTSQNVLGLACQEAKTVQGADQLGKIEIRRHVSSITGDAEDSFRAGPMPGQLISWLPGEAKVFASPSDGLLSLHIGSRLTMVGPCRT
jgi:hypothetical protein